MKLILVSLLTLILLGSCVHVYFTELQPKGGKYLTEIPKELHGTWMDGHDGVKIHAGGFSEIKIKTVTMNGNVDTVHTAYSLCDTFQLYKSKELYVFHYQDKSDYWEIAVLTIEKNGDLYLYSTVEPKTFADDKGLKLEEAKFTIDDSAVTEKTLNPEYDESISFQSAIFSGQMKTKTLRKVVTPKNLNLVFKKDGTFFSPRNTVPD